VVCWPRGQLLYRRISVPCSQHLTVTHRTAKIFVVISVFGGALIDILSGNGYFRAVFATALLAFALLANRFLHSESQGLRTVARLFWSTLADFVWTIIVMVVLNLARIYIWEGSKSEASWWFKFMMAVVLLVSIAFFYRLFLLQERKVSEDTVSDVSGVEPR